MSTYRRIPAAVFVCTLVFAMGGVERARAQSPQFEGNPLTVVSETDNDFDGTAEIVFTQTFTYQGNKRVLLVTEIDGNNVIPADGVPDQIQTTTFTYANGKLVEETTDIDFDPTTSPGVDQRRVVAYTYGQGGLVAQMVNTLTAVPADTQLFQTTTTNTWDQKGNLVARHIVFDSIVPANNRIDDVTTVYDQKGNIIENTVETDLLADGSVDIRNVTTIQRDNKGLPTFQETIIDDPFDGTPDERRTATFQVEKKDLVESLNTREVPPGTTLWAALVTFTYDQQGRPTGRISAFDLDGDGEFDDSTLVATMVYAQNGDLISSSTDLDSDADGIRDSIVTRTLTY